MTSCFLKLTYQIALKMKKFSFPISVLIIVIIRVFTGNFRKIPIHLYYFHSKFKFKMRDFFLILLNSFRIDLFLSKLSFLEVIIFPSKSFFRDPSSVSQYSNFINVFITYFFVPTQIIEYFIIFLLLLALFIKNFTLKSSFFIHMLINQLTIKFQFNLD